MTKSYHNLLLLLILTMLLSGSVELCHAQVKELPVYNEWQGRNSTFKPDRPFFLIRDVHDLINFWEKSGSDEPIPGIDFAKYMLLVWCPGSSLFDFVPVRVERFLYKEGNYFALMEFDRKDTGGYWRRPFMATMLPLIPSGDIFIMRKVLRGAHNVDWKPVYTLWDMSATRNRPLETAMIESPPQKVEFIAHAPEPPRKEPARPVETEVAATSPVAQPVSQPVVAAAPATAEPVMTTSVAPTSSPAVKPPPAAAVTSPAAETSSGLENFPVEKPAPVAQPQPVSQGGGKTVSPPAQAIDEDPLFGSEFDITF